MARILDLSLKHQLFVRTYKFRKLSPSPWTAFSGALSGSRVALVTTAAFYLEGQVPFDDAMKGGDTSYRALRIREADGVLAAALESVQIGHRSSAFDAAGIEADYNLALPVERFLELEREGVIGRLHDEALSFMGSITAPGRLVKKTAPEAAARLKAAQVDVAFLTPV